MDPQIGEHHDADARALTEIVHPSGEEELTEGPRYQFASPAQKFTVLGRLLSGLAEDRPVILWLDDLQWGSETLAMVEYFCRASTDRPPVLIVATLRAEALVENESLARRVDTLLEDPRCERIDLEVLRPEEGARYLSSLFPMLNQMLVVQGSSASSFRRT